MRGSTLSAAQRDTKQFNGKDWANIWFEKLARYHRVCQPQHWEFDEQHVIEFLRSNTETAYLKWVRRFMRERCLKDASDFQQIGAADVEAFLTDLAVDGDVAQSTQDQAFRAQRHSNHDALHPCADSAGY